MRVCLSFHVSFIAYSGGSLNIDVLDAIADCMDIQTILGWRNTSRGTYKHAVESLRRTLLRILGEHVRASPALLDLICTHRAVIGGLAALAYLLRDGSVWCGILELYTTGFWYQHLVDAIRACPELAVDIVRVQCGRGKEPCTPARGVVSHTVIHLKNKHHIVVYRSRSSSAWEPIVCSPSTADMTFVTPHAFGCAYPALTMQRRALLADMRTKDLTSIDVAKFVALHEAGFRFARNANVWSSDAQRLPRYARPNTVRCLRNTFLCPKQRRSFCDAGSELHAVDPLSEVLPRGWYGVMAMWRLWTTVSCADNCALRDCVLPPHLISTPVHLLSDPFVGCGVEDCVRGIQGQHAQRPQTPPQRRRRLSV
ncbi:hypothetical protein C8Q76DRAFT_633936 [Earliella scabrosa]|nr:hypothetical protein C8Q76DRAFT_633936 [Earliella scabrosa]